MVTTMRLNRQKLFWVVVFLVSVEKIGEGDFFLPFASMIGLFVFYILDRIEDEYEKEEKKDYTDDGSGD